MKQGVKNTFFKGMVKDLSDTMKDPSSYEDAFDIRLNSNSSDAEHVIVNIKGNRYSFSIPDVPNIITITPDTMAAPWVSNATIVHSGGSVTGSTFIGSSADVPDLFDKIENSLRTDPVFAPLGLNVSRNGTIIRVWSTVTSITDYNPLSNLTQTALQVAQTDQLPIGWTRIDDKIYIIATNNDTVLGGIGSFFRFTYDKVSLVPTVTLVYSNDLNMSTRYPIANPGGIESVMETDDIERTYWTDRYNDLRTLNLTDPNVMALSVEQLLMKPIVQLKKPTLKSVQTGGSLLVGHYQVTYALRTLGGGLTPYSYASNSIFITDSTTNDGYAEYQGSISGVVTNQSFTVEITDIDTAFEFIDIVIIRVENADSSPYIFKVAELAVTGTTMNYTHTGSEIASVITEDAFNRRINMFDKCHALAQKDNILFAANTIRRPFDIDFDARAYRFNSAQQLQLKDVNNNLSNYTLAQLATIGETDDAINPDQTIYKYQSDGVTLGGEGLNVKYEFTYRSLGTDARSGVYQHSYKLPWLVGEGTTIQLSNGTLYTEGGYYSDFKSPYVDHIYRGYRREETYRFSIVPVKNGVEGYAKWIADIKMPAIFEDYTSGTTLTDPINIGKIFPLTSQINNVWHINTLGVKFTVNTPANLESQIDSWRIKRVKLEPEQRTIIGQGFIHFSLKSIVDNVYLPVLGNDSNDQTLAPDFSLNPSTQNADINISEFITNSSNTNFSTGRSWPIVTFHSPDLLFGRPLNHRSGDRLRIVQGLATSASTRPQEVNDIPAHHTVYHKLYKGCPYHASTSSLTFDVLEGVSLPHDGDAILGNNSFENRSLFMNTGANNGRRSRGTDTTVLLLDRGLLIQNFYNILSSGIDFLPGLGGITVQIGGISTFVPKADKYMVNYERDNSGQYGGPGYSSRTQNVYINTGAEMYLEDGLSQTINVYGGDTFVNIFDSLKMTKNFQEDTLGDKRVAVGIYYPVESFVNTDLRHGYSLNGDQNPAGGMYGDNNLPADPVQYPLDYGEDFKYNYVFSEQMDTQRSFPQPLNIPDTLKHPVRIWASAVKVYGELTDAWKIFDSERYIDIQGDLGEIRQLMNASDQIVAWQQRGMGVASVNERSVVNDNIGGGIVLGQSGVLPRFDYISKTIGAWHQFSFSKAPNEVLFFDAKDGGLYVYSSQGLKDITVDKLKGWLYNNTRGQILKHDSPLASGNITQIGICSTYDLRNREFLITFYDNDSGRNSAFPIDLVGRSFTIAYNDTKDRIVSFRSFKPTMYINNDHHVITADPLDSNDIYIHDIGDRGVFYNNLPSTSHVTITVNALPDTPKVFDNTEWLSEVILPNGVEQTAETITDITSYNPYQTTGIRTDFTRRLREWRHAITYELGTRNRIRSHWMKQKFSFLNNNNKEFKLHSIINLFRPFPK